MSKVDKRRQTARYADSTTVNIDEINIDKG